MGKRGRLTAAVLALLLLLSGCNSILEGDVRIVSPYTPPAAHGPGRIREVDDYEELKDAALDFIRDMDEKGLVRVFSYDGDLESDLVAVCDDIQKNDPVGAFALSGMEAAATKIVSYYEVEFSFLYSNRVTKDHLSGLVDISTISYMKAALFNKLVTYSGFATILTDNVALTEEEALRYVEEIYYENPLEIVMAPVTAVEIFPDPDSENRLYFFTFGYRYEPSTLKVMAESLRNAVDAMVETVSTTNRSRALLTLCRRLVDFVKYDSDTAAGEYSNQHMSATAYGALVTGSAVGEGYAMAYKALCDRLGFRNTVVRGRLGEMQHAWNIVEVGGHYYHIDPSMCAIYGYPAAFLKSDEEMAQAGYTWDASLYPVCEGPLTYADAAR